MDDHSSKIGKFQIVPRVIPVLLLKDGGFYKTVRFSDARYIGDPLNTLRIFDEKEVDELCILDIKATELGEGPRFDFLETLADECFMPVSYGGGIRNAEDCRRLLGIGFEKIVLNSVLAATPSLVGEVAAMAGSQAVVASIDVRRDEGDRYSVWTHGGRNRLALEPVVWARQLAELGAGEILLTSIDRDGTGEGYDLDLVNRVADAVTVPVVACGGAAGMDDLVSGVLRGHASGVAAGSMFVFYGRRRGVLINPPSSREFAEALAAARSVAGGAG